MGWEPYDPSWLVTLAQQQLPEETWLPEALAQCTTCRIESQAYIHFIDPSSSTWQHETCVELDAPVHGLIVLDA